MIPFLRQKTLLDLFPTPEFLLLSTAGIVITDRDTRFVKLRRKIFGDGFKLVNSKKIDNPPGTVKSGLITNPEELVSILKRLSYCYGIRYANVVLPEEKAYLFATTIDWVPFAGLRDAVAFIIEENVPVSLVESVFDFEIVSEDESTGEIKLAVSVLPKSVVNAYVKIFESAGITPVSFDLESQAIARAVIHRGDRRSYIIIHLSLGKTGFYVVEEEVVQFSAMLAYGIEEDGSCSTLNDLQVEMRKVFSFWNARTDKSGQLVKKIEKAIICGFGGSKADFVEKLMGGSEVPYVLADVWLNTSSSREHVSEIPFATSLDYASAIGLVLPSDI